MMKINSLLKIAVSFLLPIGLLALAVACGDDDPQPPPVVMDSPSTPTTPPDDGSDSGDNNDGGGDSCEFKAITPNLNDGTFDFECKGNPFLAGEKITPDNQGGNWGVFGNGSNAADSDFLTVEYADNPSKSGINTSDRVLKITEQSGNDTWSGFFFDLEEVVVFPDEMNAVKLQVYSVSPGQNVLLKLEDATDDSSFEESIVSTTQTNAWEELVYNFNPANSGKFDRFTMIMNQDNANDTETTYYLDNVAFSAPKAEETGDDGADTGTGAEATEPNVSAPTPSHKAQGVLSVFSDAYDDIPNVEFNPQWGQQTVQSTIEVADGDEVLKYENLNYQGIEFKNEVGDGNKPIDVSKKTMIHLDYWVSNSTTLRFFLINSALQTGSDPTENSFDLDVSRVSQWVSIDIPLSHYTDAVDLTKIDQFKIDGDGTVYLDNIYFHSEGASLTPTAAPSSPRHSADMVISIFSDAYDNIGGVDLNPSWGQATTATVEDVSESEKILKYTNLDYQGIQFGEQNVGIDVSKMTHLHIDYFIESATELRFFLISTGPTVEVPYTLSVDPAGQWMRLEIPLSDFTKDDTKLDLSKVWQFKVDIGDSDSPANVFFDNLYFYRDIEKKDKLPVLNAPTSVFKIHLDKNVIGIFSDNYNTPEDIDLNPDWGQSTRVEVIKPLHERDEILKYSDLNYQGIQLKESIDVTSMTHFHLEYWTANSSKLNFYVISIKDGVTKETAYELDVAQKESWYMVDIPLSEFSTKGQMVDLTSISQFKVDGDGTVFFDNLYFHAVPQDDNSKGTDTPCDFPTVRPNLNDGSFDFECRGPSFEVGELISASNTDGSWGRFGSGTNATDSEFLTLDYVENPDKSSINDSNRVLKITEQSGNDSWSGFFFDLEEKVNFPNDMNAISVHVWSREPGQTMELKLEEIGNGDNNENQIVTTTTTKAWEKLIFNFSESNSGAFNRLVVLMNRSQTNDTEVSYYMDNISFSAPKGTAMDSKSSKTPTQAATSPSRSAADVISVFSDAYSDIENTDFNPNWGQNTKQSFVDIAGNSVIKYENLNYQGTAFESPIDVSGMDKIHLDYWVSNSSRLSIDLINSALVTGTEAVEKGRELDVSKINQWVSVDIPLSHFSDVVDLTKVDQLKFEGDNTVYIDNVYFYKE